MNGRKICITADCVCDLSDDILKEHNIEIVYFYIVTDTGVFRDVDEITADNIFEYQSSGGRSETRSAPPDDFAGFFRRMLRRCDEIIHIAVSSKVSRSVSHCYEAKELLGEDGNRLHIFDSEHLSTGMGILALRAAELAEEGRDAAYILDELEDMRDKISTTFIANNADYLYINGKVSKGLKNICSLFSIHPVLEVKDGVLKLKTVEIGNYEKSMQRYIRKQLKHSDDINKSLLFITHAGCSVNDLKLVKREVNRIMSTNITGAVKASATISVNCGPRTVGVFYANK